MYKYADITYPLYQAVSIETSLYAIDNIVLFRFELVQGRDVASAADSFLFKALYKYREAPQSREFLKTLVASSVYDAAPSRDQFHFFSVQAPRDCGPVLDSFRVRGIPRFFDKSLPSGLLRVVGRNRVGDVSAGSSFLKARITGKVFDSTACGEFFSMGRGVGWREGFYCPDRLGFLCFVRFVEGVFPSERVKLKGGKERETDSGVAADVFLFSVVSAPVSRSYAQEAFFVKNPHLSSFLLGDSSPLDTALGGRVYA